MLNYPCGAGSDEAQPYILGLVHERGSRLKTYITRDPNETALLGIAIGRAIQPPLTLCFTGDLGAGKTTLAQGIAEGLGVQDTVTSPTYTIISDYQADGVMLHHIDAYRLAGEQDFFEVGGYEAMADPYGVTLVEWSERIAGLAEKSGAVIDIAVNQDGSRRVRVTGGALEDRLP